MKIVKIKDKESYKFLVKDNFCLFCHNKLNSNLPILLMIDTPLYKTEKRFRHHVHLCCGYDWLKKLSKCSKEHLKLINKIEKKYSRELILDRLKNDKSNK